MVTTFRIKSHTPEYVLVSGNIGASYGEKKNITSAYAKLLCKEFLDYWDEIRSPEGMLNEMPENEY
jgi:hypothetical protein